MRLTFRRVKIRHFMSFDEAEISLVDRGLCLVNGVNNCPTDAAKSNGVGKSTAFNAICWALTGETINGVKSNIENIAFNDGCSVELSFDMDGDSYSIIRSKGPSDLKIAKNGTDVSGKGIRESEAVLRQLLPDMTSELIGSTIILGQGMPHKFSSNTPSGRKETLERLSRSDFMIADLKRRIEERSKAISDGIRTSDDSLLSLNAKRSIYQESMDKAIDEGRSLKESVDYDAMLKKANDDLSDELGRSSCLKSDLAKSTEELNAVSDSLLAETNEKSERLEKALMRYNARNMEFKARESDIRHDMRSTEAEIAKIDSIRDVCPTCGRPFEGVSKPDATPLREQLDNLQKDLSNILSEESLHDAAFAEFKSKVNGEYAKKTSDLQMRLAALREEISKTNASINAADSNVAAIRSSISSITVSRDTHEEKLRNNASTIRDLEVKLSTIDDSIKGVSSLREEQISRNAIISKMNTLVKRDFRGYLLTGVIDYINQKGKEYSARIFGTDGLEFTLDGNDIDISFCEKPYENLSGGERTRVDVIVQFALRNMIETFCDFSCNILVLDEVTDYLDQVSCGKVIDFIAQEALNVDSTFIISHHSDELGIPYDDQMTIVKNANGISSLLS